MTDAGRIEDRIEAILDDFFPEFGGENGGHASLLSAVARHEDGLSFFTNIKGQRELLEDLERACRQAQRAFNQLNFYLQMALVLDAAGRNEDFPPVSKEEYERQTADILRSHQPFVQPNEAARAIRHLADVLAPSFAATRDRLEVFSSAGNTKWRAASLFNICRSIWTERTGKPAPKYGNEESLFGRYCQSIFKEFGLRSARTAANAWWKKVHSSGK